MVPKVRGCEGASEGARCDGSHPGTRSVAPPHVRTHLRTTARSHRRTAVAVVFLFALASFAAAQTIYRTPDGQERKIGNPSYDGRFVFTRIRYGGRGFGGFFRGGGTWSHDYPAADFYISDALDTLTRMRVNDASTNVLELEDPRIFDNPILYISEPGYWSISDKGAANLRLHLLKGGLVIFDDFEHQDEFDNMAAQMAKALPERRWIKIDIRHPIFHSLFDLKKLDVPHPTVDVEPDYRALFVNDDPNDRMLALANHNCDIAEYWEWSADERFPVDVTSGAYQLGVNYIIYAMTH
jgi:hypothetical protein